MVDVTDATFETEVLARSESVPVVIDLWAEWCGPCKTLGPMLEAAVAATDGQVVLAKVDVDKNPQTAQAFRVQSIPAVYAMRDRKIVDGFVGAQSAEAIGVFLDNLLPSELDIDIDRLLAEGSESSLREAFGLDPSSDRTILALAEFLIPSKPDEALELLERIPGNAHARHLAALARTGQLDTANEDITVELEALLDRVKHDEDARQRFVDLLEVLGSDHPRTAEFRRKLTTRLY